MVLFPTLLESMDKDDDEDIGEKLHRAHEQLDAADRELAEIADLIDEIVERELEEAGVRTITSLRDSSVTIQLPIDHIASRSTATSLGTTTSPSPRRAISKCEPTSTAEVR